MRSWYRWRANPAANAGRRARQKPSFHGKDSRKLKNYELYSKLYYTTRIQPRLQEQIGGLDNLSKKERLPFIQRITREAFESETDEMKAEIEAKLEELRSASEELEDGGSPESYQRLAPAY